MQRLLVTFSVSIVALVGSTATALAQHAGDVAFHYDAGVISIIPGDEGLIFEGDFPTTGLLARLASDPGFISELDQGLGINPSDIVSYNVLDNLYYWNPATQDFASPGAATITVDNPVGSDTIIGGATGVIAPGGILGQADGDGNFHEHVDYALSSDAALGAYGLLWELDTDEPGIGNSQAFFMVFNYGLELEEFETAVGAFAAIPEPSSFTLGAMALAALAIAGRRSRRLRC
jgi:hypothetical protein